MSETTSTPLGLSTGKRSRRARLLKILSVTLFFSLMTALHMGSALFDCTSTIMGGPGDATSGGIWLNWLYEKLGAGPWSFHSSYTNAPLGERIWHPIFVTLLLVQVPMWVLTKFMNPVCSWNAMVFAGFLGSALMMYGFVRWLTRDSYAALFAGYAYAFSPFHMYKAQGHIGYLHSYLLVALLWAFLALWKNPSWRKALLFGLSYGLLFYTDGYYILIGTVGALALVLAAIVHSLVMHRSRSHLTAHLRYLTGAGFVALGLIAPLGWIYVNSTAEVSAAISHNEGELTTYSARLPEYLVPARNHPVFSQFFGSYQDAHLHLSNYSEQTLFLGWTVMLLAGSYLLVRLYRRARRREHDEALAQSGLVTTVLVVAALAGLVFSAPPKFDLLGIDLYGPNRFVFRLLPLWRVYSRFFLLVHAAVVGLAGLALAHWLRRIIPVARGLTFGLLISLLAFEMLTFPPRTEWNYRKVPAEYKWLRGQQDADVVAEYPMSIPPAPEAYNYLTFQVVHEKPLINSAQVQGSRQPLRNGIYGLADPQTVPVLRRLGTDVVLVHSDIYPPLPNSLPKGLALAARFGKTLALTVSDGPRADVALTVTKGFHLAEQRGYGSFRWINGRGELGILSFDRSVAAARVSFTAESASDPRTLTIVQSGTQLWQGVVTKSEVSFVAKPGQPIYLTSTPGPVRGPGTDSRLLSIGISNLNSETAG